MNLGIWVGVLGTVALVAWAVTTSGATDILGNLHGVGIVLGGTLVSLLVNCSVGQILSALARFMALFLPQSLPSIDEAIAELVNLARKAHSSGGLLSLRDDSRDFANGFLHRAITVAITTGESADTKRIMEKEIRQLRIGRQEDGNVFRTMSVLAPMFGIMGTLLGMIKVLGSISDPTKVGAAMAVALSSALVGIGFANFVCIPIAGQIRLAAMQETLILEILLEGVLDIAASKQAYLVELHLAAYSNERRRELQAAETAPARAISGGAQGA